MGPPEAADGPRMGTVRLDPFSTLLDEHADKGRFVRLPNGVLALHVYLDQAGAVRIHIVADDAPEGQLDLSPMAPVIPPRAR